MTNLSILYSAFSCYLDNSSFRNQQIKLQNQADPFRTIKIGWKAISLNTVYEFKPFDLYEGGSTKLWLNNFYIILYTYIYVYNIYTYIGYIVPNIMLIGPQGPVPPIVAKSVNWGLRHMESPMHTKFNV